MIVFPPSKESPSLAPELNEPLDGPSYQVGDLSIAYLDKADGNIFAGRKVWRRTLQIINNAPDFRLSFLADFL